MFPGINPRQMKQAMKQLGIKQEDLEAVEVIIKLQDRELVFKEPSVQKVNMAGQVTFQLSGDYEERSLESDSNQEITQEDIKTVIDQTGCTEEEAIEALEAAEGDLAEAILSLKETN